MNTDPLFIETLQVLDGRFIRPEDHLLRMQATRREAFGNAQPFTLSDAEIPEEYRHGKVKCRLTYDRLVRRIEFEPYRPRLVRSLKIVDGSHVNYHLKYADRSALAALFAQREACDDILICRHGYLTDTSYANVVLYDGKHYVTPSTCLLNGTRRQHLLRQNIIREREIRTTDLPHYHSLHLINALLDLDDGACIPCENIV